MAKRETTLRLSDIFARSAATERGKGTQVTTARATRLNGSAFSPLAPSGS